MAEIFITSAPEDNERVYQLARLLASAGRAVFFDDGRPADEIYARRIAEEFDTAPVVLALWTHAALAREPLAQAAAVALPRGAYFQAVLDEGVAAPPAVRHVPAYDLRGWSGDRSNPHYSALAAAIERAVAGDRPIHPPAFGETLEQAFVEPPQTRGYTPAAPMAPVAPPPPQAAMPEEPLPTPPPAPIYAPAQEEYAPAGYDPAPGGYAPSTPPPFGEDHGPSYAPIEMEPPRRRGAPWGAILGFGLLGLIVLGAAGIGGWYLVGGDVHGPKVIAAKYVKTIERFGVSETELSTLSLSALALEQLDQDSLDKLEEAAKGDDGFALTLNGLAWLYGAGDRDIDVDQAAEAFEAAAEAGHPVGRALYGESLILGRGVSADVEEGMDALKAAAKDGSPRAQAILASFLLSGRGGVETDYAEAKKLLSDAEAAGVEDASAWRGFALFNGYGVTQNEAEAVDLFRSAASGGSTFGKAMLGIALLEGRGVNKDVAAGAAALREAAEAGEPVAAAALGAALVSGLPGLEADPKGAQRLLETAVEAGDARAMGALAALLLEGGGVGADQVQPDRRRAGGLAEDAAERGDLLGKAVYGALLRTGDAPGIRRDIIRARAVLTEAADGKIVFALLQLGEMEEAGEGRPANAYEAKRRFEEAANLGSPVGMRRMGYLELFGAGGLLPTDAGRAMSWFRRAADAGDAISMAELGHLLIDQGAAIQAGGGAPPDDMAIRRLFESAAQQGAALGDCGLARLALNNRGGLAFDMTYVQRQLETALRSSDSRAQNCASALRDELMFATSGPATIP